MSSEPATKQDLADAVQQMSQNLADAVRQIDEKMSENNDNMTEAIRDSQTEVLRAFYDWSRPMEARLRHADELVQRMGWLEERVANLERGKRLPTN